MYICIPAITEICFRPIDVILSGILVVLRTILFPVCIRLVIQSEWPSSETLIIAELFMNNWRSENNLRGVDFDLYSSYEDALNEVNAWQTCNYDHGNVGFPRDCAPVFPIGCQWSSYKRGMCHDAQTHAFYIEKPQA